MPKMQYWKIWELSELLDDLELAKGLLDKTEDLAESSEFTSKEDFSEALAWEIDDIGHWNGTPIEDNIYNWFSPNGDWGQFIKGEEGEVLRARIFTRIKKWKEGTGYKPQ